MQSPLKRSGRQRFERAVALFDAANAEDPRQEVGYEIWNKLSAEARAFALSGKLKLPEPLVPLITKAIVGA